jgi:hypothetical protein
MPLTEIGGMPLIDASASLMPRISARRAAILGGIDLA